MNTELVRSRLEFLKARLESSMQKQPQLAMEYNKYIGALDIAIVNLEFRKAQS